MGYGERETTTWASSWTSSSARPYRPHWILQILRNRCGRSEVCNYNDVCTVRCRC